MECPSAKTSRNTADISEPHKSSQPNLSVEHSGTLLETDDDIRQACSPREGLRSESRDSGRGYSGRNLRQCLYSHLFQKPEFINRCGRKSANAWVFVVFRGMCGFVGPFLYSGGLRTRVRNGIIGPRYGTPSLSASG